MSACATTSPSECPASPRGYSIGDAAEDERHALLERMRVVAESDPELRHRSEANASGQRREIVEAERRLGRRSLQPSPRTATHVYGDEACSRGRKNVVVDPIADISRLFRATAHELDDSREERGIRLAYSEARRRRDDIGGQRRLARPRLERLRLIADDPDAEPERAYPAQALERVGVEIVERVRDVVPPAVWLVDPEMPPESVVLLPALDRDAERGPDHVWLQARTLGEFTPPPLLVDERLADVEDDGLQSHDSTGEVCRAS